LEKRRYLRATLSTFAEIVKMFEAILFAGALVAQSSQGYYATMFPVPTGRNGLEDYVLARDLLDQGYWQAYVEWAPPEGRMAIQQQRHAREIAGIEPIQDRKMLDLELRLEGLNLLQVREEEMSAFARSDHLVSTGNSKPCEVQTVMNGVRVPTASVFSNLGSLERDIAYVEASRSHTDLMIADLENILTMVDHGCRTTYVGSVLATSAQLKVCTMFAENLDRFSLQDAGAIEALVNRFLQGTPVFVDAYRAAFLSEQASVGDSIHGLKEHGFDATRDKQHSQFNSVINEMSNPEVDQLIQQTQQTIGAIGRTFLARFSQPEHTWLSTDALDNDDSPDPVVRTPDDIESYFALHWTLPEVARPRRLADALRARAMMRLLRLHAKIIAYRWEQGRLPASLSEMNLPTGYEYDPLSDARFVYQVSGSEYKLYSLGTKATGKIELGGVAAGSQNTPEVNP
jgi:hypothetical protein